MMVFFMIGAITHLNIFRKNQKRGYKFLPNLFIFSESLDDARLEYDKLISMQVFCLERITTSALRLALVYDPTSIGLSITSQMFIPSSVVILFVINVIFAIRLVRSTHTSVGWHPVFGIAFKIIYACLTATIIIVISFTMKGFFTLNGDTDDTVRILQRYGSVFLAVVAILPLPMTMFALLTPYSPLDRFGAGRLRTKVSILLVSTALLSLGAWFRCGIILQAPTPRSEPLPGYLGKAPYYIFNFFVEIITVLMYAILRVDLRWHVPNGAKGPGSYTRPPVQEDVEKQASPPPSSGKTSTVTRSLGTIAESDEEDKEDIGVKPQWPRPPPRIIEIDIGTSLRDSLPPTDSDTRRNSTHSSYLQPKTADRSSRGSILSERFSVFLSRSTNTLASFATAEQKQRWRQSEESRIVRRLGGPWQQLPSPSDTSFSGTRSPARSAFSRTTAGDDGVEPPTPAYLGNASDAPSIPDLVSDWTPKIEWEFTSPQRFLSLKRRTMIGLGNGTN